MPFINTHQILLINVEQCFNYYESKAVISGLKNRIIVVVLTDVLPTMFRFVLFWINISEEQEKKSSCLPLELPGMNWADFPLIKVSVAARFF